MTHIRQRIQRSPDADPVAGVEARVIRDSDGASLATLATGDDGYVTYRADGNPGFFSFHVPGQPGGDKFWSSYDAMAAGPLSLLEIPAALSALDDGVVRGYASEFACAWAGTGSGAGQLQHLISVAPGAALLAGIPVVHYATRILRATPPTNATRIDRIVLRLNQETGLTALVLLAGAEGGAAPTLTTTTTQYEISLARAVAPVVGPITITDERTYAGDRLGDSGIARVASVSTTNGSGEALSGLSITLDLPRAATYDVEADFTARQVDTAATTNWVLQGTFGSLGSGTSPNFNNPRQVAVDSSGNVYVADFGNNRVVKLNSSGAYQSAVAGTLGVTGVAVDASGNIYTADFADRVIAKFNSSGVLQTFFSIAPNPAGHIATDGTFIYFTVPGLNIWCRMTVALTSFASFGVTGAGAGQFNSPQGIATDGVHVYVVDSNNHRVQKWTVAGVYVTTWGSSGADNGEFTGAQGVALDASGDVWVSDRNQGRLQRFSSTGTYQATILQATPNGVALASGDVLWAVNQNAHNVAKWDEVTGAGGYGRVAVKIVNDVGSYVGIGERDGAVANANARSESGPGSVLVVVNGVADSGTLTLESAVLRASAMPRG